MVVLITYDKDDIIATIKKLEKSVNNIKKMKQIESCKRWLKIIEKQVKKYCSVEEETSNAFNVLIAFMDVKKIITTKLTNYEKGVGNV